MKPLDKLSNMERARLLHQLFPAEIPALIEFTLSMCETVPEEKEMIVKRWEHTTISFSMLLQLAESVKANILKYGDAIHTSSRLFAEQLFLGYRAFFMVYCLEQFTKTKKHPNERFAQMAAILFNL
jgi:hypothetical protein